MNYEKRVIALLVNATGEQLDSETATRIEIDQDACGGEFVKVSQQGGHKDYEKHILILTEEWPVLMEAINYMIAECRGNK